MENEFNDQEFQKMIQEIAQKADQETGVKVLFGSILVLCHAADTLPPGEERRKKVARVLISLVQAFPIVREELALANDLPFSPVCATLIQRAMEKLFQVELGAMRELSAVDFTEP